jgi:ComEC/Rec2-related protein
MYLKYILLILGLAVCWYRWEGTAQHNEFTNLVGEEISMFGSVVNESSFSSTGNQIIVIQPEGFSQRLRISLFHPSSVQFGDHVKLTGVVKLPENFNGFNYVKYLQKDNIFAEVTKAQIIPLHRRDSNWQNKLTNLRQYIIQKITRQLSADHAGLVLGMLIGDDSKLSQNVKTDFQKTGLTHILVVSGFNLTVIASSMGILAWVVGRKAADIISLVLIWGFVFLVGVQASVVRAGIMVSMLLLARLFGRLSYSYITLLWAIFIMTAISPLQLFYDIGFQLSIAATLGVLQAYRLNVLWNNEGIFSEIVWPSLGAIIFTAPIVAYYFQTFSVLALPANVLIVPTIPLLMLLGILLLVPGINIVAAQIMDLILNFNLGITELFADWHFSVWEFKPSLVLVMSYYVILFLVQYFMFFSRKVDLKNNLIHDRMVKIKL